MILGEYRCGVCIVLWKKWLMRKVIQKIRNRRMAGPYKNALENPAKKLGEKSGQKKRDGQRLLHGSPLLVSLI